MKLQCKELSSTGSFETSPPQSHLETAHCNPHVGECTLPLRVLAVACTMCNKALQKHCASLQDVMESYRALQDVTERCRSVTEALWGVLEHYGALRDVTGCYGSIAGHYRSITELLRNVMEALRKISILPISN